MEREVKGEREMKRRGRRGEMRKGIIVGGMVLSLLIGCSGQLEADKIAAEKKNEFLSSVVNLGNEFLNVFTSFGDMILFLQVFHLKFLQPHQ